MIVLWTLQAALAQETGFDAHGFRLATGDGDLRDPVQFVRPGDVASLDLSFGGVVEYASRPLVFESEGERTVALKNVVALDLAAGFAPVDRVRLDLSMPVFLSSTGPLGSEGPTPGDLRASLLVAALQPSDTGGFGLGPVVAVDVPTGDPERWLGTTGPAALLALASTLEVGTVTFSWLAGGRLAPGSTPEQRPIRTLGGDTLEGAASLGTVLGDAIGLGVEAQVGVPLDPVVRTAIGIPASALASMRVRLGGGGWFALGVGTGIGAGAGASPVRVVLGGGMGSGSSGGLRDADLDGLSDRDETCPGEAETHNGYRDDDGCPDTLPQVEFVARRAEADEPGAALTVVRTGDTAAPTLAMGRVLATAMPGAAYVATAKMGACFGGSAEGQVPEEGTRVVPIEIVRQDAQITVSVTDASGRPLQGAEARYLVEDDACAPLDTTVKNGRGIHVVGAGPVTVFLTAPGYGVHQESLTLSPGQMEIVDAQLAPTQVALRDGVFDLARPLQFGSGTAILGASSNALLGQVASLMSSNEGLAYQITAWAPSGAVAKRLSQERAAAVVAQLVALGVPPESLVGVGKGSLPSNQRDYVRIKVLPSSPSN